MSAPADLNNILAAALDRLPVREDVAHEITLIESESRALGWSDGKPNQNNASQSRGACVRSLVAGAQGIATTTVPEPDAIARIAEQAVAAASATARDPHRRLAVPATGMAPEIVNDASVFTRPADEILERLSAIEKAVLRTDSRLKKVVKLSYGEGRQRRATGNTLGVQVSDASTSAGFSLELLAKDGNETEAAWDYEGARLSAKIDLERIALECADHAVRSLGGKSLSTGVYPVVLAPRVGTQLLDLVAGALSAEAVQRGRSFLKGLLGKPVASRSFCLHDDPFLAEGLASEAFDDEGVPRVPLLPIRDGVLTDYFYDLRSASREGRDSNGRASKGGLGAPPSPGATNLFIAAGKTSLPEMLSSGPRVFLLREVMGLHMADPITGEFSLGGSGYLYENGRFSGPVRGVTIAGSVGGMLRSVEAAGNDLRWYGSVGAPSLLVSGLTVAGS